MRYQIIRAYEDCACATEMSNDLISILNACAIYWEDPTCWSIEVYDNVTKTFIINLSR